MRILISILVIICGIVAIACPCASEPTTQLRVAFLNVGLGDAILISCPGESRHIIIDAGPPDQVATGKLISQLKHYGVGQREIELAINTHADLDHFGGFDALLNAGYLFRRFIESGTDNPNTRLDDHLRANLDLHGITRTSKTPRELQPCADRMVILRSLPLTDRAQKILDCPKNLNDCSLKLKLSYHNKHFLLLADATTNWDQQALLDLSSQDLLRADVLKVGHHASSYSTSKELLNAVAPRWIVMTTLGSGPIKDAQNCKPAATTILRLSDYLQLKHPISTKHWPILSACQMISPTCFSWKQHMVHSHLLATSNSPVGIGFSTDGTRLHTIQSRLINDLEENLSH